MGAVGALGEQGKGAAGAAEIGILLGNLGFVIIFVLIIKVGFGVFRGVLWLN
jgi:hypothetical protein